MAGGRFSVLFRRFFQVGTNFRPIRYGVGGMGGGGRVVGHGWGGRWINDPYGPFGVAVATWCSYNIAIYTIWTPQFKGNHRDIFQIYPGGGIYYDISRFHGYQDMQTI